MLSNGCKLQTYHPALGLTAEETGNTEIKRGHFLISSAAKWSIPRPLALIHEAQLMSYLRLANIERGLLINFHAYRLADGIQVVGQFQSAISLSVSRLCKEVKGLQRQRERPA